MVWEEISGEKMVLFTLMCLKVDSIEVILIIILSWSGV